MTAVALCNYTRLWLRTFVLLQAARVGTRAHVLSIHILSSPPFTRLFHALPTISCCYAMPCHCLTFVDVCFMFHDTRSTCPQHNKTKYNTNTKLAVCEEEPDAHLASSPRSLDASIYVLLFVCLFLSFVIVPCGGSVSPIAHVGVYWRLLKIFYFNAFFSSLICPPLSGPPQLTSSFRLLCNCMF